MGVWTNIVTEQSTLSCLVLYLRLRGMLKCWQRILLFDLSVMTQCDCTCYRQDSDCDSGAYSRSSSPEPIYERLDRWVVYTSISRYLLLHLLMILLLQILWKVGRQGAAPVSQPSSVRHQGPGPHKPSMILNIVNTLRVAMSRAAKLTTCCGFIVIWPWPWLLSWKVASLCCARAAIDSIEKSNQWTL